MLEMVVVFAVGVVWSGLRLMRCDRCGVPTGVLQALATAVAPDDRCAGCRALEEPGSGAGGAVRSTTPLRDGLRPVVGGARRVRAVARAAIRAVDRRWDDRVEIRRWLRANPPASGRATGARV